MTDTVFFYAGDEWWEQSCSFLKKGIALKKVEDLEAWISDRSPVVKPEWIIVSKDNEELDYPYKVVIEFFFQQVLEIVSKEYYTNYDYYYLKNALEKATIDDTETLVLGSSYSWLGINQNQIDKCVNLSLASQDFYYAGELMNRVIEKNNGIKNVVIGCGYYTIFSDLSMSSPKGELYRLSNVYLPILRDPNNAIIVEYARRPHLSSAIFDTDMITNVFMSAMFDAGRGSYVNESVKRESLQHKIWGRTSVDRNWNDLTENEQREYCALRAEGHNKALRRKHSYYNNLNIIRNMSEKCAKRGIHLTFMVFPGHPEYARVIDPHFRQFFYDGLESIEYEINVLDLFEENDIFKKEDFLDTDHLNDSGAKKATEILDNYLRFL